MLRNLIADDIRVPPEEIFPKEIARDAEPIRAAKEAAICRIMSETSRLRLMRSLTSWPAMTVYVLLIIIAGYMIFRRVTQP